jgi:imidazolonepropionase-like amidohydrolase
MKAGVEEAHNRMKKYTVHAMGTEAVANAVDAGIDGVEHGTNLTDELVAMMKARGVYYVPTMSGIAAVADREAENGSAELAAFIRELVVYPQRESLKKAYRAGLLIGAGTDTLGDMVRELELFAECGMRSSDCLRAATIDAARILGKESEIGSLEDGKRADLFVVRGNPLEDLSALAEPTLVVKGGNVATAEWLCGF